jgi:hypothetical protein
MLHSLQYMAIFNLTVSTPTNQEGGNMRNVTEKDGRRIQLQWNYGGWSARFVNDAEVFRLFGTYTIPTAFTRYALQSDVVKAMQELNPSYIIEVL